MTNSDTPCAIVGLGEVLWDVFPDGPRFGGAPANFACATAELLKLRLASKPRLRVAMASGVGQDDLGRRAIEALAVRGVDTQCVAELSHATGTVTVALDNDGGASYEFASDTAWDNLEWNDTWASLAQQTVAVCFGTLGQRCEMSRATIQQFVNSVPQSALRVFDVNIRRPFISDEVILSSLKLANILKLNDEELPVVASLCGHTGSGADVLRTLADRFELMAVALTRGAEGALLLSGDQLVDYPGVPTRVVDTVGAGDAFTAAFVLGLLADQSLPDIGANATRIAAYVCAQRGATPTLPDELVPQSGD
ncbi:MAG: carbohydrate kinase [Pirellulales bacterium]|nr:carbohydrate kinase [Pirellulales bacterium]